MKLFKRISTLLALSLWFVGCSHLSPHKPFQMPQGELSQQKKEELYREHQVVQHPFYGPLVQGKPFLGAGLSTGSLPNYMEDSGDPVNGDHLARIDMRTGLATLAVIGGMIAGLTMENRDSGRALFWTSAGLSIPIGWFAWNSRRRVARDFNQNLKSRLGLDPGYWAESPELRYPIPMVASENGRGLYWILGVGPTFVSGKNFRDYYQSGATIPSWPTDPSAVGHMGTGIGVSGAKGWTAELKIETESSQGTKYEVNLGAGNPGNYREVLRNYRWGPSLVLGKAYSPKGTRWRGMLGVQGGYYSWSSSKEYFDYQDQSQGRAVYSAWTPAWNAFLRTSYPLIAFESLDMEFGYRAAMVSELPVAFATGVYSGTSGPLLNYRGQKAGWDHSGPYFAISISLGRIPFTK